MASEQVEAAYIGLEVSVRKYAEALKARIPESYDNYLELGPDERLDILVELMRNFGRGPEEGSKRWHRTFAVEATDDEDGLPLFYLATCAKKFNTITTTLVLVQDTVPAQHAPIGKSIATIFRKDPESSDRLLANGAMYLGLQDENMQLESLSAPEAKDIRMTIDALVEGLYERHVTPLVEGVQELSSWQSDN